MKQKLNQLSRLVETRHSAPRSDYEVNRLNELLRRRTAELAESNRLLQKGIVRYKSMETTLKKSEANYIQLLEDSLLLQESLRQLARQGFTAHEEERKRISHELKDEVAQLLLSVNVRLLSIRRGGNVDTTKLKKEIASARRLVSQSVTSVRDVATGLQRLRRGEVI
jgi:signal transduction histidine kinase